MSSNFVIGLSGALITVPTILFLAHYLTMRSHSRIKKFEEGPGRKFEPTTKEELVESLRKKS